MFLTEVATTRKVAVRVSQVSNDELLHFKKRDYFFDWLKESSSLIFKLDTGKQSQPVGLISLKMHEEEQRIEIRLLASCRTQVGAGKQYDGVAECLIGYACILALERYGAHAAVSLVPKSSLRKHYISKYGFEPAGISLCLTGTSLFELVKKVIS